MSTIVPGAILETQQKLAYSLNTDSLKWTKPEFCGTTTLALLSLLENCQADSVIKPYSQHDT